MNFVIGLIVGAGVMTVLFLTVGGLFAKTKAAVEADIAKAKDSIKSKL